MIELRAMIQDLLYASVVSCLLATAVSAQSGSPDPLVTQPASTLGAGAWSFSTGVEYTSDGVPQPLLGKTEGDLTRGPLLRFVYGLGERGQIEAEWPVYQDFDATLDKGGSSVGDVRLWTKVAFRQNAESGPIVGIRFGLKAPNASEEDRLGTDEADLYLSFLLEQPFGSERETRILFNAGLGILGDPLMDGEQEDVITYGLAVVSAVSPRVDLLAELSGYFDDPSRRNTGDLGEGRLGVRFDLGSGHLHAAAIAGYTDISPDWGINLGYRWSLPRTGD